MIPRWRAILKTGDTVPVSDPECTRFWMRMDQAVEVVDGAIKLMRGGEVVIPRLPAFRLADLATAMGAKMDVIGLPSWEKKHEGMDENNLSSTARRMSVEELKSELEAV